MRVKELTVEERINEAIKTGQVPLDDEQLVRECASRYVATEYRRLGRARNRDVERNTKIRQRADERLRARVRVVAEEWKAELHAEWDLQLMDSTFSVGDGVVVRYGDATAEQHARRAELLENMAAGDLHTASIHRRAVDDITDAGAATLDEVLRGR